MDRVHVVDDSLEGAMGRDLLIASDAAVQVQARAFGQLSTELVNCISVGRACVATRELAVSCDAPDYVFAVPDDFSPLQVAEQLAGIWELHTSDAYRASARAAYLETHNFDHYAKRLIEILTSREAI